jgi:predicted Fe-S protein YdhL (DUF1289 family)
MLLDIKSPCIKHCKLNDFKICLGCGRTLEEISNWTKYDETLRRETIQKAGNRLSKEVDSWNE